MDPALGAFALAVFARLMTADVRRRTDAPVCMNRRQRAIAHRTGSPQAEVKHLLESGSAHLLAARDQRPAPQIDRTIYSAWNGLAISSLL